MEIGSGLTYKKAVDALIRLEIEKIENFLEQIKRQNSSDSEHYEKEYDNIASSKFSSDFDRQSYLDSIEDNFYDIKEVDKLAEQLTVVALYKLVELKTKASLHVFSVSSEELKNIYRIKELKKIIKRNFGFNLPDVSHYEKISELRELNNSIKHNGTVSKELGTIRGWSEGDEIKELDNKINEYKRIIPAYFGDLLEKLELGKKLKTK